MGNYDDQDKLIQNTPSQKVRPTPSIPSLYTDPIEENSTQKKKKLKKHKKKSEAKDHFTELTLSADQLNKVLVANNIPFRFCVYSENDEVMIDIARLNKEGTIDSIEQKNITHDEFQKWVQDIEKGEGLFFDHNA